MINFLCEQLSPLGNIYCKRMFGCQCIFIDGIMTVIIKDDDIFIKKLLIDNNDERFGYYRQGKLVYLNYVLIDNAMVDEQDELIELMKSFLS